jgi:hypothetical protein
VRLRSVAVRARPVRPAATVQNGKRIAVNVSMVSEDVHGSPWAANLTKQR